MRIAVDLNKRIFPFYVGVYDETGAWSAPTS